MRQRVAASALRDLGLLRAAIDGADGTAGIDDHAVKTQQRPPRPSARVDFGANGLGMRCAYC